MTDATPHRPIDHLERERAASALNTSVALVAGAGAGKTSVLVARIVATLKAGVPPEAIAAITFTEKAAGELVTRVRDGVEEALEALRADQGADGAEIAALTDAIAHFDALTLSTIHAFCADLLRREALAARWSPDVEIDPKAPLVQRAYATWRRDLDARLDPEDAIALRRHVHETSPWPNVPSLHTFAMALLGNRDLAPHIGEAAPINLYHEGLQALRLIEEIRAIMEVCTAPDTCNLYNKVAPWLERSETLVETLDDLDTIALAMLDADPPKATQGRKGDWPNDGKARLQEAVAEYTAWHEELAQRRYARLHRELCADVTEHLFDAIADARNTASVADFNDLLFESAALLTTAPDARARLAKRYEVILIDEVQDTDPIQTRVATLLTRATEARGDWRSAPPAPGRLFAVGDPHQSIYRFRRADVALWRELRDLIDRDGEVLHLTQNFRSVPGIVHWVNHTFSGLQGYQPQRPWRAGAPLDAVVQIEADGVEDLDAAARHLWALIDDGATVIDEEDGTPRPMRWGDVMLLLPSWTKATKAQRCFDALGVDVHVEGGSALFERDEVRFALAGLRAIDDPLDAAATTQALRGLFGISHEEFARHRAHNGSWCATVGEAPEGPIAEAFAILRDLHRSRSERGCVELLDALLHRSRAEAVWAMMERGKSALTNLDGLRAMLREAALSAPTLGDILEAIDDIADDGADEFPMPDVSRDAVRVTTYFKAKGREAPVVVLLHANRSKDAVHAVPMREEGTIAARASKTVRPPNWDALKEAEQAEQAEERRRWLYVACTRARDQLVIVRGEKARLLDPDVAHGLLDPDDIVHGDLHEVAPQAPVRTYLAPALPTPPRHVETFPGHDPLADTLLDAPPDPACDDPAATQRQRRVAAVAQAKEASRHWSSVHEAAWRGETFDASGSGLVAGRVLHDVLAHIDLHAAPEPQRRHAHDLCAALGRAQDLSEGMIEDCIAILDTILANPILDEVRAATDVWREVPFSHAVDGAILSGRIDLCFPRDHARTEWVVVDWKSSVPEPGTPLHQRYTEQITRYADALRALIPTCQHVDTIMLGPTDLPAHPEEAIEADLSLVHPDLEGIAADLHALGHTPEIGYPVGRPIYTELEIAWPERHLGVGLDLARGEVDRLEGDGWEVIAVETTARGWAAAVTKALLASFEEEEDR